MRYIASPQARFKAALRVEVMNARICTATLQEHVKAIIFPSLGESRPDNRLAVSLSAKLSTGNNVLNETMPATFA